MILIEEARRKEWTKTDVRALKCHSDDSAHSFRRSVRAAGGLGGLICNCMTLNSTLCKLQDKCVHGRGPGSHRLDRVNPIRPTHLEARRRRLGLSRVALGMTWLEDASKRSVVDPSRLGQVLRTFAAQFGPGYAQRATEAVRTYRAASYLAACTMSGAAAESVLLGLVVAKVGNEAQVLDTYNTAVGRARITKQLLSDVATGVAKQFEAAIQVLHYCRDDAAHGTMTTIDGIEAYAGLTQLLRLAQFASDHWIQLTRRLPPSADSTPGTASLNMACAGPGPDDDYRGRAVAVMMVPPR
jgi:hypothetical protein